MKRANWTAVHMAIGVTVGVGASTVGLGRSDDCGLWGTKTEHESALRTVET